MASENLTPTMSLRFANVVGQCYPIGSQGELQPLWLTDDKRERWIPVRTVYIDPRAHETR